MKILWLKSAIDDLIRLRKFLIKVNPRAARESALLIKRSVNKLKEFSFLGVPVEDLEDFYDLFVEYGAGGYYIRYRIFKDNIYIVYVKHSRELR
jgi:plasmid stabilization system protein ParE